MAGSKGASKPGRRPLVYQGRRAPLQRTLRGGGPGGRARRRGGDRRGGPGRPLRPGGGRAPSSWGRASTRTGSTTRKRLTARQRETLAVAHPRPRPAAVLRGLRRGRRRSTASTSCGPPTWPCGAPCWAWPRPRPGAGGRPHRARARSARSGRSSRATPCRVSHRRRLHRGQGRAGRYDAGVRPALSRLRPRPEHGLRERGPSRRPAPPGALRDPPPLLPGTQRWLF